MNATMRVLYEDSRIDYHGLERRRFKGWVDMVRYAPSPETIQVIEELNHKH